MVFCVSRKPRLSCVSGTLMPKCKALMKIFMYPQEPPKTHGFGSISTYKGIGLWTERKTRTKKKIDFYCEIKSEYSSVCRRSRQEG